MSASGAKVISRRMRLITRNVKAEVVVALDDAADDLLSRARQLAPQLTGELIGSGDVRKRRATEVISREVFFRAPYAVVRHEDHYNLGPISSLKSSPDGPVGRKYLSRPLEIHRRRYVGEIGAAVRRGLRASLI